MWHTMIEYANNTDESVLWEAHFKNDVNSDCGLYVFRNEDKEDSIFPAVIPKTDVSPQLPMEIEFPTLQSLKGVKVDLTSSNLDGEESTRKMKRKRKSNSEGKKKIKRKTVKKARAKTRNKTVRKATSSRRKRQGGGIVPW